MVESVGRAVWLLFLHLSVHPQFHNLGRRGQPKKKGKITIYGCLTKEICRRGIIMERCSTATSRLPWPKVHCGDLMLLVRYWGGGVTSMAKTVKSLPLGEGETHHLSYKQYGWKTCVQWSIMNARMSYAMVKNVLVYTCGHKSIWKAVHL